MFLALSSAPSSSEFSLGFRISLFSEGAALMVLTSYFSLDLPVSAIEVFVPALTVEPFVRLILKSKNTRLFRQMINAVLKDLNDNKDFKEVRIYADINGDIGL